MTKRYNWDTMNAEIISVGTEILLGHITNTNAAYLAGRLAECGIDLFYQTTVGDNQKRLLDALAQSSKRARLIFTTGGLGPTIDDITAETIGRFTGKPLVWNKAIQKNIERHFRDRSIPTPPDSLRQAYIPEGARWFRNAAGTAPGLIMEYGDSIIIALPGPPRELEPMFEQSIFTYLKKRHKSSWTITSRCLRTTGLVESQIHNKVKDLLRLGPNPTVGIYAHPGEIDLKITAKAKNKKAAYRAITKIERCAQNQLKGYVFGTDDVSLEKAVGAILTKRKKTIATAESCTGGLLSHRLSNVSGSSKYFTMGVISYSNAAKIRTLGVQKESIRKFGAVSKQVAQEMAQGIRSLSGADIGVGITGIAGPTGATKNKPVGLVYIALSGKKNVVKEYTFKGTREEIKYRASQTALDMVRHNA